MQGIDAAADALVAAFDLRPTQVQDLLDSRFGRHLADDLSFIESSPTTAEVIEEPIRARLASSTWRKWFANINANGTAPS